MRGHATRAFALLAIGLAWLAAGPVAAAPTRVLGGDVFTLGGPDRGLGREDQPSRFSLRDITDQRHLAELGHVGAQFNLGVMYSANERYRAAQHWYRKAALRGHREAAYNLGILLLNGQGTPPDPTAAARWFGRAAERDLPEAQYQLGRLHYEGEGVARDPVREQAWYRRAAEAGYPLAQHDLAVLYHLGEGVPRDDVEAFAWFSAADASGFDCRDALAVVAAALPETLRGAAADRAAAHVARYARR